MNRVLLLALILLLAACPKRAATPDTSGTTTVDTASLVLGEAPPEPEPMAPPVADPATSATFAGRTIDIAPHVAGFPYRSFRPFDELGVMLYMHETSGGLKLHQIRLRDVPDFSKGTPLTDIDWNTRSLGSMEPLPSEQAILFKGDEDNREEYDLYKLFLADGRIEKLTDVPYIYGWGVDHPRERLAWVARYPVGDDTEAPTYRSCLETMPLGGGDVRTVVCDDAEEHFGALNFIWTGLSFSPDGAWVYADGNLDGDRNQSNLLRIRLEGDVVVEQLTDPLKRTTVGVLDDWLEGGRYVYLDNASGFVNVGIGSHGDGSLTPITSHKEDLREALVLRAGQTSMILTIIGRPWENELQLLDAQGRVLAKRTLPENLYLLHHRRNVAYFYATSRTTKMRILKLSASEYGGFILAPWFGLPDQLADSVEHCNVSRVEIPTFDVDPATGAPRMLHAYWSTPKVPPADGAPRFAGITSFYGGGNTWNTSSQILCQAGISELSPAVRGSWGFGAEFHGLNDGDLGGDEIVDLQWMAKWLVDTHGFQPEHIGVHGGSHGGYASMRALTFPPETNGRNSSFDWGWGVSFFGFSDIKTFYETCNIPDWVKLEAGDPATEPDKIRDRSPLHHVDLLEAPILLLHGENDLRVPVQESRQFAEACAKAGKDCTYLEFPGQGHGLRGIENQVTIYRAWFDFLTKTVADSSGSPQPSR